MPLTVLFGRRTRSCMSNDLVQYDYDLVIVHCSQQHQQRHHFRQTDIRAAGPGHKQSCIPSALSGLHDSLGRPFVPFAELAARTQCIHLLQGSRPLSAAEYSASTALNQVKAGKEVAAAAEAAAAGVVAKIMTLEVAIVPVAPAGVSIIVLAAPSLMPPVVPAATSTPAPVSAIVTATATQDALETASEALTQAQAGPLWCSWT